MLPNILAIACWVVFVYLLARCVLHNEKGD